MLPTSLNTNEIKNAAGTEVEFGRQFTEGRKTVFEVSPKVPNRPHLITVQHSTSGKGSMLRRRSNVTVSKDIDGADTSVTYIRVSCTLDIPEGNIADLDDVKDVMAELISGLASTGADTVVKFDCSGTLTQPLLNGSV